MNNFNILYTKRATEISETPWNVYPRPSLKRDSFFCLNGEWDFAVTKGELPADFDQKIIVPYPIESVLSKIGKCFCDSDVFWYKKVFDFQKNSKRVLLHFGAVYQSCEIFLNGKKIGENDDGYNPFCIDISDFIKDTNILIVRVKNVLGDHIHPCGKSVRKRGGMWYTAVTGIWQTVWLEEVCDNFISDIKIDCNSTGANVFLCGDFNGYAFCEGEQYEVKNGRVRIEPKSPKLWSPEEPHLYNFSIVCGDDKIESYFALRTLEIREVNSLPRLCLNGKPYYFNGLLDQGYWPDGLFTPPTPEGFADDISAMKNLGFNMLRKHIKVEPELFYYECDRLGMIVFQDMVNNGDYSFLRDTLLPTFFSIRKNDKYLHSDNESRNAFTTCMKRTVSNLYNHPSICAWTIFNEGWGQFCGDDMYEALKSIDKSRFIDTASGWFLPKKSDFLSRHIYFKKLKNHKNGKPYFISEFGGYSYKMPNHVFNTKQTYGYGKFDNADNYEKAVCSLFEKEVLPLVKQGLCASVYTQVSDVEDETNGLLTYDRLPKLKTDCLLKICERIKEEI